MTYEELFYDLAETQPQNNDDISNGKYYVKNNPESFTEATSYNNTLLYYTYTRKEFVFLKIASGFLTDPSGGNTENYDLFGYFPFNGNKLAENSPKISFNPYEIIYYSRPLTGAYDFDIINWINDSG